MRSVPLTSGLSIYAAMTNSSKSMLSDKVEIARLCQSGRFADALRICEPLCTEHPGDPELWFLSGAIHGALGDFARAEICCRSASSYEGSVVGGITGFVSETIESSKIDRGDSGAGSCVSARAGWIRSPS